MPGDLTRGPVARSLLAFTLPLTLGNLLQQLYNITDTAIVGRFIGSAALAAVGSAYSLMTFVTSLVSGLCLGAAALLSRHWGARDMDSWGKDFAAATALAGAVTVLVTIVGVAFNERIVRVLNTPPEVEEMFASYLMVIWTGMGAIFISNLLSAALRSSGDPVPPLVCYAVSVVMNIVLDLIFVIPLGRVVVGAAEATVISQWAAAALLLGFTMMKRRAILPRLSDFAALRSRARAVAGQAVATGLQQSVMNFGILMVQGLVNTFGVSVMAAFAAGVKIDSFAYLPAQDFGNAWSFFAAQNTGAGKRERVSEGLRKAIAIGLSFGLAASLIVNIFARPLLTIFIDPSDTATMAVGVEYLRAEGAFYALIAALFLLYGHFRAIGRPFVSLLLTVISLGSRVALSYAFAPSFGAWVIWRSIPAGWLLADLAGLFIARTGHRRKTA